MPTLFSLYWAAGTGSQITLDLIAAAGSGLRSGMWLPKMATPIYRSIPPYLIEEMDILADRSSHNLLATTLQSLDQMRWFADRFRRDQSVRFPVWFYVKMENETATRRAYIREISGDWRSQQINTAGEAMSSMAKLRIRLERHPYWEDPVANSGTGYTAELSGASILFDYGAVIGDVPARMKQLAIGPDANGEDVDRLWLGIRSTKFDTPGNFLNIWELEDADATAGTDCSAPTTDATASPGGAGNTKRIVNFATVATWAKRLTISVEDLTANYIDQFGQFLWLFRTKVGASTTCEVQLRWGYTGWPDDDFVAGPIRSVSNTDWDYKEMGVQAIPGTGAQVITFSAGTFVRGFTIQLWARRTSGTGSLDLDCFCPVPLDEGWLIAKNIGATTTSDMFYYGQAPGDHSYAGEGNHPVEYSEESFRFPPGDGRLVVVYAESSQSVLSNAIRLYSMSRFPRWCNLAGSE